MKNTQTSLPRINLSTLLVIGTVIGITAGILLSLTVDASILSQICSAAPVISKVANGDWFITFLRHFALDFVWLAVAFTLGFSPVYQPACFILLMSKGAAVGFFARGVYLTSDVLASLAVFLPASVAFLALLMLQTKHALNMSGAYLSMTVTNENRLGLKNEAGEYVSRFLMFTVITGIISALRCLIICLLAR